ncbi:MAG: cyclophilin-like fold protein [Dehalococcoidales bacterium]|nr:cyclophilin-like fold protein [Dehalococcoidales bacterium]
MPRRITIRTGSITAEAELIENNTANAIWEALPINGDVNIWGDEVYFFTSVSVKSENGREVVSAGDIAYWPPGKAFCIFFGPTPASRNGSEIRAASAVNVFGKLAGDPKVFTAARDGQKISIGRIG